jgi:membrane protease YdiL (CAAX protease family)
VPAQCGGEGAPVDALDHVWRPAHWLDDPPAPATTKPLAEIALVGGLAAAHVADHRIVPTRFHIGTHLLSAAAAVAAALGAGATLTDLGLRPDRMMRGLRRGLITSGAVTGVVAVGALLPQTRRLFVDNRVLDVSPGEVAYTSLVRIPFGTALYEEVVFRGVVLGLAMRRLPPLPAVAFTSVLFGLWHVLPSLADREHHPATREAHPIAVAGSAVLSTTIAGMLFGWERLRANSVVAPILTHTATNAVTFAVASLVSARTAPPDDAPPATSPPGASAAP